MNSLFRPLRRWLPAVPVLFVVACGGADTAGGPGNTPAEIPDGQDAGGVDSPQGGPAAPAPKPDAGLACAPGTFFCAGNIAMACQPDGTATLALKCSSQQICVDGACEDTGEVPGEGAELPAGDGGEALPGEGDGGAGNPGNEGTEGGGPPPDGGSGTCGAPGPEICDGIDNDCDGQADENLTQSCDLGCGPGIATCVNGEFTACDAPTACGCEPGTMQQVACGLCGSRVLTCQADGTFDDPPCEDQPANACGGCIPLPAEIGAPCGGCGVWTCDPNDTSTALCDDPGVQECMDIATCTPYTACGGCPAKPAESCNGKDDDCDPTTVEDGQPADCAPGLTCMAGVCVNTNCQEECPGAGASECVSPSAVHRCGQFDGDSCLDWGPAEPCAGGKCESGACASSCGVPDALIVLDKSGSMDDPLAAGQGSKWSITTASLVKLMNDLPAAGRYGLTPFPGKPKDCVFCSDRDCTPGENLVPMGNNAATQIKTQLATLKNDGGATPIGFTLQALVALPEWQDTSRAHAVVLLTDGADNCPGADAVAETGKLKNKGVHVFVAGIGGGVNASALNAIATAGGTGQYYAVVTDGSQLDAALADIMSRVASLPCP